MEDVLQADIFFFITTISVVVVTIALVIALVYVVVILRTVRRLLSQVEEKAAEISGDITELRANVREKARQVSRVVSVFSVAQVSSKIMSFFQNKQKKPSEGAGEDSSENHREEDSGVEDEEWTDEKESN